MGLIKSSISGVKGNLKDQWKDVISCDNLDNEILMRKIITETGIISSKSKIIVQIGQLAVITDNGKIVDATAEEGVYTIDETTSPSFFAGDFGDSFKDMWSRFTFGGQPYQGQAVYYINTKEILDNKFGTKTPIPYRDFGHLIKNKITGKDMPMSVEVKCFGKYTFKIVDPSKFMKVIAGTKDIFRKEDLIDQIRTEVMGIFNNVLNSLGSNEFKVKALELPSYTDEIKDMMDKMVFDKPIRNRGLKLTGFIIESVTLDEKSMEKINKYEISSNSDVLKGNVAMEYMNALKKAGENENGAANSMMGIGMMNMGTGNVMNSILSSNDSSSSNISSEGIVCPKCGTKSNGKFCPECGTKLEKEELIKCSKCGSESSGKFCPKCGNKLK